MKSATLHPSRIVENHGISSCLKIPKTKSLKSNIKTFETSAILGKAELAEDVLEIITVFSARLYGSRSHKNKRLMERLKQVSVDAKTN